MQTVKKFKVRTVEWEVPIRYCDGETELYRVQLVNEDNSIAYSGRGFESFRDSKLYHDGMHNALQILGLVDTSDNDPNNAITVNSMSHPI